MVWAADIVYISPLLRLIPNELIYIYTCLPPPPLSQKTPRTPKKTIEFQEWGRRTLP